MIVVLVVVGTCNREYSYMKRKLYASRPRENVPTLAKIR